MSLCHCSWHLTSAAIQLHQGPQWKWAQGLSSCNPDSVFNLNMWCRLHGAVCTFIYKTKNVHIIKSSHSIKEVETKGACLFALPCHTCCWSRSQRWAGVRGSRWLRNAARLDYIYSRTKLRGLDPQSTQGQREIESKWMHSLVTVSHMRGNPRTQESKVRLKSLAHAISRRIFHRLKESNAFMLQQLVHKHFVPGENRQRLFPPSSCFHCPTLGQLLCLPSLSQ